MTSEYKSAADEDPKQHIRRLNALIEQLIETNAQNVAKLTEVEAQVASAVADAHHFNRQAGEYEARLAEATRLLREMRSLSDIYPAEVDAFLGTADSAPAARITHEWLEQNPEYTCGCGLYVHPSRRNPAAIHIADCQFATDSAAAMVTYHGGDPCQRFRQYKRDPVPPWAQDVQDEQPDSAPVTQLTDYPRNEREQP